MIKVSYNVKILDKNSDLYGYIVERKETFKSLSDATMFVRKIPAIIGSGSQLVGLPTIEGK